MALEGVWPNSAVVPAFGGEWEIPMTALSLQMLMYSG